MPSVLKNPAYEEILNTAEECEIFQKMLLEDDLNDIDNICKMII